MGVCGTGDDCSSEPAILGGQTATPCGVDPTWDRHCWRADGGEYGRIFAFFTTGGRLRAAQRKLWAWVDLNVIDLGRQMHLSPLPPLMVYMAAGISGLTAIVGTFFVKGYLGLSAVACRLVQPPKIGLVRLGPRRSVIRRSCPSNLTP
jgi:hypothetical protein